MTSLSLRQPRRTARCELLLTPSAPQVKWSLSLPSGEYRVVTTPVSRQDGTKTSLINQCGQDQGAVKYRIIEDTRVQNFWNNVPFTTVSSVAALSWDPGGPACNCQVACWEKNLIVANFTIIRATADFPLLEHGKTLDAGYKSSVNAYMMYQSFLIDVDEVGPSTVVQAILRDDDDAKEVAPFGTETTQYQTRMFLQSKSDFEGNLSAGAQFVGTCLRSDENGNGVGDQRTAGPSTGGTSLGFSNSNMYVSGFHYTTPFATHPNNPLTSAGQYVLHVFRTCSTGAGNCDETAQDTSGKSFQFKLQAQVIKNGLMGWTNTRVQDASAYTGSKPGHGRGLVVVSGQYIVGVGGTVSGTGVPMTIYDTKTGTEHVMPINADLDDLDFPTLVATLDPAEKAFYVTGGNKESATNGNSKINAAYSVFKVTITHTAGAAPSVNVTDVYRHPHPSGAVNIPQDKFAARYGAAGVAHGNKILIQGGYHLPFHAKADRATGCSTDATDQVWAFDVTTRTWDNAAFAQGPENAPQCPTVDERGRARHAAVVVDGKTLRISGGFRSKGAAHPIGDQWMLDLNTKVWTKLNAATGAASTDDSAVTRADHSLAVLGKSLVVMFGGFCRTSSLCDQAYALTQPFGADGKSLEDPIMLNIGKYNTVNTFEHPTGDREITNKAVLVGNELYLLALGDTGNPHLATKTGSIWSYKIASHVASGDDGVDDKDNTEYGSVDKPYKTLSYAVNRGGAPVVVLMTGNHWGAGNADAMLAGSVRYFDSTCTTYEYNGPRACNVPLVVTAEADAVLTGNHSMPGATVTGAITVLMHGFTIAAGNGKHGGALFIDHIRSSASSSKVRPVYAQGMTFKDNTATYSGGCIYAGRRTAVYNSTASGCQAANFGGAVYANFGADAAAAGFTEAMTLARVVVRGSTLPGSNTQLTGGLISSTAKLSITDSDLSGGRAKIGGCVHVSGLDSAPSSLTSSTIRDCEATNVGGGLYVNENDRTTTVAAVRGMTVTASTISGCKAHAGAGVFLTRGYLKMVGSTLQDDEATFEGGGLTSVASIVSLSDTDFVRCKANRDGGGISATLTQLTVKLGSTFEYCEALRGAALRVRDSRRSNGQNFVEMTDTIMSACVGGSSGAIHASDADLFMTSCTVQACTAKLKGGGMFVEGLTSVTVSDAVFTGNNATDGGAIALAGGEADILDLRLLRNSARRDGGGMLVEAMARVTLTGAEMKLNKALRGNGGALAVLGGGRLTDVGQTPTIYCNNCDIRDNRARRGGGIAETCERADDFADGLAPCPEVRLERFTRVEANEATHAGAGAHWLTRPLGGCICGACVQNCSNIRNNVLTASSAYGAAQSSDPVALKVAGVQNLGLLSSGVLSREPVVFSMRDSYDQTVTSGDAAGATLIAAVPPGLTLSQGLRLYLANGTVSARLEVIGPEGTYDLSYAVIGFARASEVTPVTVRVTIGACAAGEYFDGLVCKACGAGTFLPSDPSRYPPLAGTKGSFAASCHSCPAGFFSENVFGNDTACVACPRGTSSSAVGAKTAATCVACAEDFVSDRGSATCRACGVVYSSNHDKTACVLSSTLIVVVAALACALVAGCGAAAQSTFKFGNRNVAKLMALARAGTIAPSRSFGLPGKGGGADLVEYGDEDGQSIDEDGEKRRDDPRPVEEVEAAEALDAILGEARVLDAVDAAVTTARDEAARAVSALTGVDPTALVAASDAVLAHQLALARNAVDAATSTATSAIETDGLRAIHAAVEAATSAVAAAVRAEADAALIGTLTEVADAAALTNQGAQSAALADRLRAARDVDAVASDALCAAAALDALDAVRAAESAAESAKSAESAEAVREYLEQCAAVRAKIAAADEARRAALEARRAERAAPGTPEAEASIAADAADAQTFLSALDDAAKQIGQSPNVAEHAAALGASLTRLRDALTATGATCGAGLEARLAIRRRRAEMSHTVATNANPAGLAALEGVLAAAVVGPAVRSCAMALGVFALGGSLDPTLAAAVDAAATADAALAAAALAAGKNAAGAHDAVRAVDSAGGLHSKAAAELAAAVDVVNARVEGLARRRHDALAARLAAARRREGGDPPEAGSADALREERKAVEEAAAALREELLDVAAETATFDASGVDHSFAAKQLAEAQRRLAKELRGAAAGGKRALEARLAARRAREGNEAAALLAAAAGLGGNKTDQKKAKTTNEPPDLRAAAAAVLAAGRGSSDVDDAHGVDTHPVGVSALASDVLADMARTPCDPASARAQFDAQFAALRGRVDNTCRRRAAALRSRLEQRGAGRAALADAVSDTAPQVAAAAALDRAADSAAAAAAGFVRSFDGANDVAADVAAAARAEATRQKDRLDAMGGSDVAVAAKTAVAAVFAAASKAQEVAAARALEKNQNRTTLNLVAAAAAAAQLAAIKRAKLTSQHDAETAVLDAERRSKGALVSAAALEADAAGERALAEASAAADASLSAAFAAVAATAAVDPSFDAAKAIRAYQRQCEATHDKIQDAAKTRRERLLARLAKDSSKLLPIDATGSGRAEPEAGPTEMETEAMADGLAGDLEALAAAVESVSEPTPPGIGEAARRHLARQRGRVAESLRCVSSAAKAALGDRLADRRARLARAAAVEEEAAARLDAALVSKHSDDAGGGGPDVADVAAALAAAVVEVHAAAVAEAKAASIPTNPAALAVATRAGSIPEGGDPSVPRPEGFEEARAALEARRAAVRRRLDASVDKRSSAMASRVAARKAKSEEAKERSRAAAAAAVPGSRASETPGVAPSSPRVGAEKEKKKKPVGFIAGIRQGMRERALAAALVQQQEIMLAAAHGAETSTGDKKKAREMDGAMMEEMMKDHANKIREMQGKMSVSKDAKKKALEERLAKKKAKAAKGNQVAPHTALDIE